MSEEHECVKKMDSYDKEKDGIIFHCTTSLGDNVDVRLTVCSSHILRFRMCPDVKLRNVKGMLEITQDWVPSLFKVSETPDAVTVDTGVLRFEAQRDPWKYVIYDKSDEVVLEENVRDLDAHTNYRSLPLGFTIKEGQFYRSNETFRLHPGENFYGFGEKFTRLNKRGQRIRGWNTNPYGSGTDEVYKHIPFFMSSRGYGVFINTTYRVTCDMGSQSLMAFTIMVEDARLDLFILYGPSLKDVLTRYMEVTGWPTLPPKESFGIWHTPPISWSNIESVVDIGKKFRVLNIPVDYFMTVELTTGLAETKEICEKLGRMGIKVGMYVAPLLNVGTEMEKEARVRGYTLTRQDGSPYVTPLGMRTEGERGITEYSLAMVERDEAWRNRHNQIFYIPCLMPDFTNPDAVKWWKDKIAERMKAGCYGIAMSDFGEDVPADACYYNKRSGLEMHNVYTLLYQKASYEAVAENTEHRAIINARSGTAGLQRYPICWSGDPNCDWEDVLANIRAGLSIGLSGVPFWSCDTGGFQATTGHLTPELWIRWLEWAIFLSHVRLHGAGSTLMFDERTIETFRTYAKLRYRLLPYIFSHAYNATKTGTPMMRAMVLEFQDDPNTYDMEDQYMFGQEFLVAPVFQPTNRRTVYLPEGAWFEYWTRKEYKGPITLYIEPPLEVLPLYVRGDSIIPMAPEMSYIGEKPFNPITLEVWLCSEAEFTIYDDDEVVRCCARKEEDKIVLDVGASNKIYIAKFNKTDCPKVVSLNGVNVPRFSSYGELESAELGWYFDSNFTVYTKFNGLGSGKQLTLQI